MNFYLLLKTDISEGSDYKPCVIGAYASDAVARNKALHVAEDYFNSHGGNCIFDDEELRVADELGIHGIQMNVVKMSVTGIEITPPLERA